MRPLAQNKYRELSAIVRRSFFTAVSVALTEFGRCDYSADQCRAILSEIGVSKLAISVFSSVYDVRKPLIQKVLTETAFSIPKLVDVKWRLDYKVSSTSGIESTGEPSFLLDLIDAHGQVRLCCGCNAYVTI